MAASGGDKSADFYAVLGLKKECTTSEIRNAYKKLAMKWHPDRCSALRNSKYVEEAKKKFQDIQQAYSVLSDLNKRFLYDFGVYDCEDEDDENGMGDFLNEMATMMSQNKSNEKGNESLEELQGIFNEMFQNESFNEVFQNESSYSETYTFSSCKRRSSEMGSENLKNEATKFEGFCIGNNKKCRR